jgi:hypothetical protein
MALHALFIWVAFPDSDAASDRVTQYLNRNGLRDWLTGEEAAMIDQARATAHEMHVQTIGWRLENMWALAWVLGFEPEPGLEASQIREDVTRPMFYDFLTDLDGTIDGLLAKAAPRPSADVIAMEYRFYCAHNAVRSAQLGGATVPDEFDPIEHGGAVHERRHSLTWTLSPDACWEETDLST